MDKWSNRLVLPFAVAFITTTTTNASDDDPFHFPSDDSFLGCLPPFIISSLNDIPAGVVLIDPPKAQPIPVQIAPQAETPPQARPPHSRYPQPLARKTIAQPRDSRADQKVVDAYLLNGSNKKDIFGRVNQNRSPYLIKVLQGLIDNPSLKNISTLNDLLKLNTTNKCLYRLIPRLAERGFIEYKQGEKIQITDLGRLLLKTAIEHKDEFRQLAKKSGSRKVSTAQDISPMPQKTIAKREREEEEEEEETPAKSPGKQYDNPEKHLAFLTALGDDSTKSYTGSALLKALRVTNPAFKDMHLVTLRTIFLSRHTENGNLSKRSQFGETLYAITEKGIAARQLMRGQEPTSQKRPRREEEADEVVLYGEDDPVEDDYEEENPDDENEQAEPSESSSSTSSSSTKRSMEEEEPSSSESVSSSSAHSGSRSSTTSSSQKEEEQPAEGTQIKRVRLIFNNTTLVKELAQQPTQEPGEPAAAQMYDDSPPKDQLLITNLVSAIHLPRLLKHEQLMSDLGETVRQRVLEALAQQLRDFGIVGDEQLQEMLWTQICNRIKITIEENKQ